MVVDGFQSPYHTCWQNLCSIKCGGLGVPIDSVEHLRHAVVPVGCFPTPTSCALESCRVSKALVQQPYARNRAEIRCKNHLQRFELNITSLHVVATAPTKCRILPRICLGMQVLQPSRVLQPQYVDALQLELRQFQWVTTDKRVI